MSDARSSVDLGRVGVWSFAGGLTGQLATEQEKLGFGAIWIGGSPKGDLRLASELLGATSTIAVATGIVNIWKDDASTVAESYRRITAEHPGRFLLGIGVGHPEAISAYQRPFDALSGYLDRLDQLGVPRSARVIAALGPRVLRLAGERCAGRVRARRRRTR
jgi:probable F420-dependent oxidoreductase